MLALVFDARGELLSRPAKTGCTASNVSELYPTDNEWGVPELRLDQQARIVAPVVPWGSRDRRSTMAGTWVFYVDDYRFGALAKAPLQLQQTGCAGAAELNFTCHEQTPRAEVLWATYRKRAAARQWQDNGLPVLVDLNVPEQRRELCLLGVPRGWRSFATRGYAARPEALAAEWRTAREFGGEGVTLLVYGGGPSIEALCRELPGAVYAASHRETAAVATPTAKLQPTAQPLPIAEESPRQRVPVAPAEEAPAPS